MLELAAMMLASSAGGPACCMSSAARVCSRGRVSVRSSASQQRSSKSPPAPDSHPCPHCAGGGAVCAAAAAAASCVSAHCAAALTSCAAARLGAQRRACWCTGQACTGTARRSARGSVTERGRGGVPGHTLHCCCMSSHLTLALLHSPSWTPRSAYATQPCAAGPRGLCPACTSSGAACRPAAASSC